MSRSTRIALLLGCLLLLSGCSVGSLVEPAGGGTDRLRIMVPQRARGRVRRDRGPRCPSPNARGSPTTGSPCSTWPAIRAWSRWPGCWTRRARPAGDADEDLLGVVGATIATGSSHRVTDGTPIARLLQEPEAVLVPGDSPYRNLADLIEAWRDDPAGWQSAARSAIAAAPITLMTMQLSAGAGPGPAAGAVRRSTAGVNCCPRCSTTGSITGPTSPCPTWSSTPSRSRSGPTAGARGVRTRPGGRRGRPDADRGRRRRRVHQLAGRAGPPGVSAADRAALTELFAALEQTQVAAKLAENHWTGAFLAGDDFAAFLEAEDQRVRDTLADLGLG